jgi:murein DD-endopeptidase MepM/ murein hydrolase activator NlpD
MSFMRRFRALTPVLAVLLLAVSPITAGAQSKEEADAAAEKRDEAYQQLIDANQILDEALLRYQEINSELVDLNWRIGQLFNRVQDYEDDVKSLRARARHLVIEAYVSGGTDLIQVALEADSIQDVLTSQVLIERATERDIADLDRLDAVSREMDRLKAELETDQARVEELQFEALVVVQQLDFAQRSAADAFRSADAEARKAYRDWQAEEKRRRLAELARKQGAAGGLPPGSTPAFVCPVEGGASFINDWGFPRSGGRTHKGTDMFAKKGTPTVAVGDGVVTLKSNSLGGTVVLLRADHGVTYYYAHLDGYASGLNSGQRVSAGQRVGYVGNTGNALGTSPHLHFEMWPGGGSAVNPYPTLTRNDC